MTPESLRSADWDRIELDVVARIRLLRAAVEGLEPGRAADLIVRDLIGPNVRRLAEFCESVAVTADEVDVPA